MVYAGNALVVRKWTDSGTAWDDGYLGPSGITTNLRKTNKFVILITAVTAGKTVAEINDNASCDSGDFETCPV